jgi:hypothetical protein
VLDVEWSVRVGLFNHGGGCSCFRFQSFKDLDKFKFEVCMHSEQGLKELSHEIGSGHA